VSGLAASLFNRLEEPSFRLAPRVAQIRDALKAAGAEAAMMTGSGSAVFGLCRDQGHAEWVMRRCVVRPGAQARIVHTLPD
jgi:4-diphosphocytidyl-2-C-methyl-D-erythritol kinase